MVSQDKTFEKDPGRGRWLCEEEAIQLKVSTNSNVVSAYTDLFENVALILVFAN